MMLVDSHCHLDYPEFAEEFSGVLDRAAQAGIGMMLTISTSLATFPRVLAVAEQHDNIYCSVGVHPHEAEKEPDVTSSQLVALAGHDQVVAIGETGLDYFYEHSPREVQQALFRAHISAARETGLPLIVHARDADENIAEILLEEYRKGPFPGLIHCFSSSGKLAETALEIGFYISFSGILTFKNAEAVREVAEIVPLDRLLVETDAPYLAPMPHRGKQNEPAFTANTAQRLAQVKGLADEEIAAITSDNFFALFTKAQRENCRLQA